MSTIAMTLIGKPGCHLCDDAREAIAAVLTELGDAVSTTLVERSILDDAELADRYAEEIPVVLIGGKVHTIWRVDPARLRTALLEVSTE